MIGTGGSGGLADGVDGNIVLTSLTGLGLAALGNYGGPTQTMALLPGSPAIGAGVIADYPGTSTPITTDQRGLPLDSPNPDIGAFQTQGSTLTPLSFSGISNQSIAYDTSSVTISGTLANGSQAPVGETVAVTLDGVQQSATIGSGGAFSTTFDTTGLTAADSPYTITYAYSSDGTFASASTTSTLTLSAAPTILTVNSLGDAGIGSGDSGDLRYCINQANADDEANRSSSIRPCSARPRRSRSAAASSSWKTSAGTQTITGPAAGVTISGGGNSRVFQVDDGVTASISGLTISGGSGSYGNGGGLLNSGAVTLFDCTLSGNSAAYGNGGGVCEFWPGQPDRLHHQRQLRRRLWRRRVECKFRCVQSDPDRLYLERQLRPGRWRRVHLQQRHGDALRLHLERQLRHRIRRRRSGELRRGEALRLHHKR